MFAQGTSNRRQARRAAAGFNQSLQATGAACSVLDGVGDSLLPGFVAASFSAPVPELGR